MATPGKQVKLTTALGFRSFKSCLIDFRMLIPRGEKKKEEKNIEIKIAVASINGGTQETR